MEKVVLISDNMLLPAEPEIWRGAMRRKFVLQSAQVEESSIITAIVFAQVLDHLNLNGAMRSKLVSQSALVGESWMKIASVFAPKVRNGV